MLVVAPVMAQDDLDETEDQEQPEDNLDFEYGEAAGI
jgi:hypothetical protein